jgi:hypothetical protein
VLALLTAASASAATFPGTPDQDPRTALPNDPGYASHEHGAFPTDCGSVNVTDIFNEESGYYGFPALEAACAGNLQVSGISVDRAWQLSMGRPDTFVAIIDTGIRWDNSDLRNQVRLNWAELPPPERADGSSPCDGVTLPASDARAPVPACYLGIDGKLDVDAYKNDPRVLDFGGTYYYHEDSVTPANDSDGNVINAGDLIHTFSDWCRIGASNSWVRDTTACPPFDNDGNGYAHDIAGWNFFDNNNDAQDLASYSSAHFHGNGRTQGAVAAANNGIGSIGTCPSCTFLPLRINDSFVVDTNAYGAAAVYATDMGAASYEVALGGVDNTAFARAATAYAVARGTVPVIVSSDLNTADHNFPTAYPDVVMVNGLLADTGAVGSNGIDVAAAPHTYFRLSNVTQNGDHADIAMGDASTGSEATGKASGVLALIMARSRELADGGFTDHGVASKPLTALEAEQVVEQSADGVIDQQEVSSFAPTRTDPATCPCPTAGGPTVPAVGTPDPPSAGTTPPRATSAKPDGSWSNYFGYGRINARRALEMLGSSAGFPTPTGNNSPALPVLVPPEVSLQSPDWWEQIDPTTQANVQLVGYLGATRPHAFQDSGHTATFTVEAAPGADPTESQFTQLLSRNMTGATENGVLATLNTSSLPVPSLAVLPSNPEAYTVSLRLRIRDALGRVGETRRVVHLHHDPTLRYMRNFGGGVQPGPRIVDLRGDGHYEAVVATDSGELHVFDANGNDVPWFNGGHPFVAQRTGWALHTGAPGLKPGVLPFPASTFAATPAVGDLFGDGRQEIVAAEGDGHVDVLDAFGNMLPGFPTEVDPNRTTTPVANERDTHNHQSPGIGASPVLGHLDDANPAQLDIVVGGLDQRLYAWRPDGAFLPTFNGGAPLLMQSHDTVKPPTDPSYKMGAKIVVTPAIGSLLGDGKNQIVATTTEMYSPVAADLASLQAQIAAGTLSGTINFGVSQVLGQAGKSIRLYAVDRNGVTVPGYPLPLTGLTPDSLPLVNSVPPALADFGKGERVIASVFSGLAELYDGAGHRTDSMSLNQGAVASGQPGTPIPPEAADSSITLPFIEYLSVGDITGQHRPGIFQGGITAGMLANFVAADQNLPYKHVINGWDPATGQNYPTFPVAVEDYQLGMIPAVGPVGDASGFASLVAASSYYEVHAFNLGGLEAPGFPKFTGGWGGTSPALGDIDRDGKPSNGTGKMTLLAGTKEGRLYSWSTGGDPCQNNQWWSYHHDEWSTGAYGTETRPPGAITDFRIRAVTHGPSSGGFTADWTSSGDHFECGTAKSSSLRISNQPITPQNFAAATVVGTPVPAAPGVAPTTTVTGQNVGQCLYVALQVTGNTGLKSPVAEALDGPDTCPPIPDLPGITNPGSQPSSGIPEAPTPVLLLVVAGAALWARRRLARLA